MPPECRGRPEPALSRAEGCLPSGGRSVPEAHTQVRPYELANN